MVSQTFHFLVNTIEQNELIQVNQNYVEIIIMVVAFLLYSIQSTMPT